MLQLHNTSIRSRMYVSLTLKDPLKQNGNTCLWQFSNILYCIAFTEKTLVWKNHVSPSIILRHHHYHVANIKDQFLFMSFRSKKTPEYLKIEQNMELENMWSFINHSFMKFPLCSDAAYEGSRQQSISIGIGTDPTECHSLLKSHNVVIFYWHYC